MEYLQLIQMAMRTSGVLAAGQTPLQQDIDDASACATMLLEQWRQKRWLVFRLNTDIIPISYGQMTYTVGPDPGTGTAPDFITDGDYRPANIQSCYLRLLTGSSMPGASFPMDYPMHVIESREQYDQIRLKYLQSWPMAIYYDPQIPYGVINIWPVPVQTNFALYIAWQTAIDEVADNDLNEITEYLPAETQLALMYSLAQMLVVNYKLPPDAGIDAAARAAVNTLRQANFALQTLAMPRAVMGARRRGWLTNPTGGFNYPETAASVNVTVAG